MRAEAIESVSASDIAPKAWPSAKWLLSHPRLVDGLIIAISVLPQFVALSLSGGTQPAESWITVSLAGIALWWRRKHAFWVLIALAAVNSLHPSTSLLAAFAFTGYTLAGTGSFTRTMVGFLSSLGVTTITTMIRHLVNTDAFFSSSVTEPIVLIAIILGLAARGRRDQRTALAELINQRIENTRQLERTRIAAEMHDVVAHSLSVMIALADGALASRTRNPEQSAKALEHLAATSRNALIEMQTIVGVLRTSDEKLDGALDDSGYNVPPLENLVEVFRAAHLPVVLVRDGSEPELPPNLQTAVYRIAQESLTNALRYARNATCVELRITATADDLTIRVTDDGLEGTSFPHGTGQGLIGIGERAKLLGGVAHAGPAAVGGWVVDVTLPIRRQSRP